MICCLRKKGCLREKTHCEVDDKTAFLKWSAVQRHSLIQDALYITWLDQLSCLKQSKTKTEQFK